jgi:hypothetical protein
MGDFTPENVADTLWALAKMGAVQRVALISALVKPTPETRNPEPETRDLKPRTRDPKPETRNPKPKSR